MLGVGVKRQWLMALRLPLEAYKAEWQSVEEMISHDVHGQAPACGGSLQGLGFQNKDAWALSRGKVSVSRGKVSVARLVISLTRAKRAAKILQKHSLEVEKHLKGQVEGTP